MNTTHTQKKSISPFFILHSSFYSRGFTFVESLVAISILLLAVVGPLFLASQGLRAARIARDQINANYLAQEVIEYIRYRRDTNALTAQDDWLAGLSDCIAPNSCRIDVTADLPTDTIALCSGDGGACPVINFNDTTGEYGYGDGQAWVETKFVRTISIDTSAAPTREAAVTVTITWKDGMINRTYPVTENLMNWEQ